eukprot:Phypoly_transcript_03491.p1 GENE.Phypoly_transcript_03491~~Phypoly_transcript_03491.p1  ORF type:complete len:593 (+),score=70.39 Phypoly_transcript_03491:636-2414(+)
MLASSVVPPGFNPTNWWMSEKYDGSRVCWNPIKKLLYSRATRILPVPSPFLAHFPNSFVDGEIWFGRATFDKAQKFFSLTKPYIYPDLVEAVPLQNFRVLVFDDPGPSSSGFAVQHRMRTVLENISPGNPILDPVAALHCHSRHHATQFTCAILESGGEGIILRMPGSFYTSGFSDNLYKIKAFRDREGLVVGCELDGKTYTLELPDGITFQATANLQKLPRLPIMGEVVLFTYLRYHPNGKPASPSIDKIRTDISWQDVLNNFGEQILDGNLEVPAVRESHGHWTVEGDKTRKLLDEYAREQGLDPKDPETWYSMKGSDVLAAKGSNVLHHYASSLSKAVLDIYPEIGLDSEQFKSKARNYWNKSNRKKFLDNFAKTKGFDPLVAENWYLIQRSEIKKLKSGSYMTEVYGGSTIKTIMDVYPNIGLEETKFYRVSNDYLKSNANGRGVLESYARSKGFDPLQPENWYSFSKDDLITIKGGELLLKYHGYSVIKLLTDLFPDIGLERERFSKLSRLAWNKDKRREIAHDFAKRIGFNSLVPEEWRKLPKSAILCDKQLGNVIRTCYCGSVNSCLEDLFSFPYSMSKKRHIFV